MVVAGDVLAGEEVPGEVQPRFRPLDVEVEGEGDGIVLVVDLQDVGYLDAWNVKKRGGLNLKKRQRRKLALQKLIGQIIQRINVPCLSG